MARKTINQKVLDSIDVEFVNIDQTDLDVATLQKLDIWVDEYNHGINPQSGISSSMLLSVLVLENIVEELVEDAVDNLSSESRNKAEKVATQLKEGQKRLSNYDFPDVMTVMVMSSFIQENQQLERIKPVTIANDLTSDEKDQYQQYLTDLLGGDNLITNILNKVIQDHPDSLEDQLTELLNLLPNSSKYETLILKTIDLIKEQTKFRGGGGTGEIQLPDYDDFYPEAYTKDKEWMPKVVLLAKHVKVWLHQLSRKYETSITTLDQIPDEELQEISERGFTGLWLIGIWERSKASKKIKERMGNPDAAASAYSLWDYVVASELGGHDAYYDLSERAGRVQLRLASDMVPNHTGILSKWVIEHPDWFIQTRDPPFPSYEFQSEDLSDHPHVDIYLEDHYYSHSDAAVVFKRVDTQNNDVRYIYHGNDGTSIPWNDTAQLDFLREEVRHHVINTIVHVAKMFPIIRLDAAMVLTKKHFQRLWYPVPGTGGDIPSRSRYGLSHEEFHRMFPVEFWREVVDRIEDVAPNTLLVAEAFWMLEGYFVRTLGVHRVYNSAFMHMLRDQKNEEYRGLIKSTLTYDPRILQRYVNFMSNPDEDTAIEQFGNGDKYFGVTVMMATLPGMPMFGHGQIEGFREKYGMEFQRDYWEEDPDKELIKNHENLIFPLLRKRYLFAQVKYFRLYDYYHPDGYVIEDIYALSNRVGSEFVVVLYNNAMDRHSGWIKSSLPFNSDILEFDQGENYQSSIGTEISQLPCDGIPVYCLFKSFYGDNYYLRSLEDLHNQGMYSELRGYQFKIFHEFKLIPADSELATFYSDYDGSSLEMSKFPDTVQSILSQ